MTRFIITVEMFKRLIDYYHLDYLYAINLLPSASSACTLHQIHAIQVYLDVAEALLKELIFVYWVLGRFYDVIFMLMCLYAYVCLFSLLFYVCCKFLINLLLDCYVMIATFITEQYCYEFEWRTYSYQKHVWIRVFFANNDEHFNDDVERLASLVVLLPTRPSRIQKKVKILLD